MSRILVVEDYPPIAAVLRTALRRVGHRTSWVSSVEQALSVDGEFDAAICDLELPDGDGVAVARGLLEDGSARVALFYTASRDPDLLERARGVGPVFSKDEGVWPLVNGLTALLAGEARVARVVGAPDLGHPRPSGRSGTRRRIRR